MQIPRSYIESYSRALNVVSERARAALEDALSQIDYTADVASIRETVIAIMQPACGASTTMAARLAAEFYDGLRLRFGISDDFFAEVDSRREPEATSGAVRAFASELDSSMPNVQAFQNLCVDRIDYETRRAANECMAYNARNDPKKPRWARIPTGIETCDFCIMLASRGFVYHSEDTASHAHANCDCRITPSWDKSPVVQGYDPGYYLDVWNGMSRYDISAKKISDYCLLEENKAIAYKKYLGFERGRDEAELTQKLYAAAAKNEMIYRESNEYGDLYYQNAIIEGHDGKTAKVKIAWIKLFDGGRIKMTTAFVDE